MAAEHDPDCAMKEANLEVKEHLFHVVCFHARLLNHNGLHDHSHDLGHNHGQGHGHDHGQMVIIKWSSWS